MTGSTDRDPGRVVVIRNPASGDRAGSRHARDLARERGYEVRDTARPGHATELAAAATGVADTVVACGGDGTVNEVVAGVDRAGGLDDVTLAVVPTGTGNGFAEDVGIDGLESAYDAVESGERRRLDLGMAGNRPFLKTCVSGLPAGVSAHTTGEMKRVLGVLAYGLGAIPYAVETLEAGVPARADLTVRVGPPDDPDWIGPASLLLVGNSRQFPGVVFRQAPMEDGLLEVVVVKRDADLRKLADAVVSRRRIETPHLLRLRAAAVGVEAARPALFSVDGELVERSTLEVTVRPRAVRFVVGPGYDPG